MYVYISVDKNKPTIILPSPPKKSYRHFLLWKQNVFKKDDHFIDRAEVRLLFISSRYFIEAKCVNHNAFEFDFYRMPLIWDWSVTNKNVEKKRNINIHVVQKMKRHIILHNLHINLTITQYEPNQKPVYSCQVKKSVPPLLHLSVVLTISNKTTTMIRGYHNQGKEYGIV